MSQPRSSSEQPHTTLPVEMGNITTPEQEPATAITTSETQPQQTTTSDYTTTTTQASSQPAQSAATRSDDLPTIAMPPPAITRQETEAIGPSTDLPTPSLGPSESTLQQGPVVIINLLLTSTGARHPYKIDEKYLNKRGVTAEGEGGAFDPFVISVYTLKELIWRDWRAEWETKPSSPSAIRLIHFGRLLEDKAALKDCRFNATTPNVVHMSVKPADTMDDEEGGKGTGKGSLSRGDRDAGERTPGCRCVIL